MSEQQACELAFILLYLRGLPFIKKLVGPPLSGIILRFVAGTKER